MTIPHAFGFPRDLYLNCSAETLALECRHGQYLIHVASQGYARSAAVARSSLGLVVMSALALGRHAHSFGGCPLSGANRTRPKAPAMPPFDRKRTRQANPPVSIFEYGNQPSRWPLVSPEERCLRNPFCFGPNLGRILSAT